MPALGEINLGGGGRADYYEIAIRQFVQQILPSPLPVTTVWGYGTPALPGSFSYPSFTIEALQRKPVRVKWINGLVDALGKHLPHILPVDQTLHWANPPGPRDSHGMNQQRYAGPVPIVTHLHGSHSGDESDGYPEAWFLPNANNIPAGYFKTGSFYDFFKAKAQGLFGQNWDPGTAVYQYPNDQRATTLWYHDNRAFFEGLNTSQLQIPFQPMPGCGAASDVPPIWNPEFFGNSIVVNGRAWPYLDVERRQYPFSPLERMQHAIPAAGVRQTS